MAAEQIKPIVLSNKAYEESFEKKGGLEKTALMKLIIMGSEEIADGAFSSEDDFLNAVEKG
jgi:HKD family nuclease